MWLLFILLTLFSSPSMHWFEIEGKFCKGELHKCEEDFCSPTSQPWMDAVTEKKTFAAYQTDFSHHTLKKKLPSQIQTVGQF